MSVKKQTSLSLVRYGITLLALFAFLFGGWATPPARAQETAPTPPGADVSISADNLSFGANDAVTLHVTIHNPNNAAINILTRLTPVDGTEKPLFTITRDGEPVAYLGKIVKFATPTEQDYTALAAGESITRDVDLATYYDLSTAGSYSITYHTASTEMYTDQSVRSAGSLISNTLQLLIAAHAARPAPKIVGTVVSGGNTFTSCSASQQTALVSARNSASTYASNGVAYFNLGKKGARYTTWFGVFDATRYNTVRNHFNSLKNAVDNANPINFDCSCTDPYYAYVYPNSPYDVYLCTYFWSAPLTGTDSKAGTLIHEISHFTIVANTDDHAYGQTDAKQLAKDSPALAIMNADNHEYFAENTPALEPDTTLVFYSSAAQDGWVRESTETSVVGGAAYGIGPSLVIGDSPTKQEYRSILSFNTSSLPDTAVISAVTLKVKKVGVVGGGDPVTAFQGFMADIKTGFLNSYPALQIADFQSAAGGSYGPFLPAPVSNVYSINLTGGKALVNKLATNSGLTQIRLRFKLDDNNNAVANYLNLYSGEAALAADRPQLVVTYTVP